MPLSAQLPDYYMAVERYMKLCNMYYVCFHQHVGLGICYHFVKLWMPFRRDSPGANLSNSRPYQHINVDKIINTQD
ncbi:hypothetical protein EJB05_51782 [Eragrostis curvula]|uniref:Uncharacterized protein n=1 Tax=Eragrostis curvula TaxID=38414 RepID=A0A5J9SUT8_9POAL|nr:hypothetical protein EJB05_51782 [Eragrostis curvula]